MSAERFFDDLARTLAEPMPRRRAVRAIGASLAALAVPGVPPLARAATSAPRQGIDTPPPPSCQAAGGPKACCTHAEWKPGTTRRWKVCGYPYQRYDCVGPDGLTCVDRCKVVASGLPPDSGQSVKPSSSAAKQPNGAPVRFECCIFPDTVPSDGYCVPCANICQPARRGQPKCCPERTTCCFNNTSTACCGPEQTCKAQGVRQATCLCPPRTSKCGPHCCARDSGETCCGGKTCCGPGEKCLGTSCCPKAKLCGPSRKACCGDGEFCFWKAEVDPTTGDVLRPLGGTCKRGCTAGNRAGGQCCGTGYRPNRSRTACEAVPP